MPGIAEELERRARAEGFDLLGICSAAGDPLAAGRLHDFIAAGRHGDMEWMVETLERRASPQAMWPEARSAIVFALNYGPDRDPFSRLENRDTGVISVYALNRDYHDLMKGKLKRLAQWFAHRSGVDVKVFVDTAPLMEKPLAQRAGLGWQGRHTNLVSRELGSWFFLGAILTTADLPASAPDTDHCGSCRACLDICPTRAFPAPYQLDARRCISYLTIEHKGHIAREFRIPMGNRIYGCDDCLAVCPWNKFARQASEAKFAARDDLVAPPLADLARLDDTAFRSLFSGSPVKRIGRDRFLRNVLIAIGNSGDARLAGSAEDHLDDASALVRAMAVWALSRLLPRDAFETLRRQRGTKETDPDVIVEWSAP